jgi:hypothetical protein
VLPNSVHVPILLAVPAALLALPVWLTVWWGAALRHYLGHPRPTRAAAAAVGVAAVLVVGVGFLTALIVGAA